MATEIIKVPDIGTSDKVTVVEVSVKVGDVIAEDDTLIVLETDKASMDVPAPMAGKVTKLKIAEGDEIGEGDEILYLEVEKAEAGNASSDSDNASTAPAQKSAEKAEAAPEAPAASGAVKPIEVPDIGTTEAVEIIEVHVSVGDIIAADDAIVTLETDKASMEVPAPEGGEVVSVKVKVGDSVSLGDQLIEIRAAGGSAPAESKPAAPEKAEKAAEPEVPAAAKKVHAPAIVTGDDDELIRPSKPVHAGPAVRLLARELGVDLAQVRGSGPRERILKEDLTAFVKKKMREPERVSAGAGIPAVPDQDFSKFGSIEVKEMGRIQQLTAANMARNWLNIPHVTQFDEADVTDLESFRNSLKPQMEKRGVKISPLAFLVKACAAALHEFPNFNVSLMADGKHIVQKHYVNIGIAVDTPNGLIVPVIKDADKKSIWQIAEEIIDFAQRGRKGQIKSNEMQGGCFTISSLGGLGGTAFTPIVNAPEVAILGVSKNQVKPFWTGKEFVPRTFTPLSLSYDHRAVNGADAAKFTTYVCEALTDLRRILL
ncbi:dihydrolipoyllysine-residue acetyltransferase [Salinispirillum sp. LH 10-3-1]|uniref:Acetyltransferase component of pyruvate dehydrogenase complex n=1 Tax=Salinispirillum sp. LH 10-3-1 TaxID=2952525 RepID=A0AB38YJ35_9GAMM